MIINATSNVAFSFSFFFLASSPLSDAASRPPHDLISKPTPSQDLKNPERAAPPFSCSASRSIARPLPPNCAATCCSAIARWARLRDSCSSWSRRATSSRGGRLPMSRRRSLKAADEGGGCCLGGMAWKKREKAKRPRKEMKTKEGNSCLQTTLKLHSDLRRRNEQHNTLDWTGLD